MKLQRIGMIVMMLVLGMALCAYAQQDNGGPGGPPGGGMGGPGGGGPGGGGFNGGPGGPGGFDPAQFQQQQMDNIKQQLGAGDDDFAALQPKIQKVMDDQRAVGNGRGGRGGRGGGPGGPGGGPNGPGGNQPQTDVQKAQAALQTALQDSSSTPDLISSKLQALRDAKSKAQAQLTADQKDLQSLLTQRQEAVMVMMGYLN